LLAAALCLSTSAALARPLPSAPQQKPQAGPSAGWPYGPTNYPAVARVMAPGQGTVSFGSGTLVAVSEKHGLVVTNWHVVNEAIGPVTVMFPDGFCSTGTVQKIDRDWDLAAIAIWRPNCAPVPVATTAPLTGELLTIAGYGAGNFRAASGHCTQYVAPGPNFPFEMVELSTAARQGDSGGPILNSRGELAGVLFGAGDGRTAGSYCGRVRWFLDDVVPARARVTTASAIASASPQPRETPAALMASTEPVVRQVFDQRPSAVVTAMPRSERPFVPSQPQFERPFASSPPKANVEVRAQHLGWNEVAGTTAMEQAKTALAIMGAVGALLHVLKWLTG